jgi:hypothetical protein
MALTEQHAADSFFQTTHARVDSKLHSDSSSEKVDDLSFASSLQRPLTSGLRRCAGTRDLTRYASSPFSSLIGRGFVCVRFVSLFADLWFCVTFLCSHTLSISSLHIIFLYSIRPNVNYCAKVSVEYMMGDPSTPFHSLSWKPVVGTDKSSEDVLVDNVSASTFLPLFLSNATPSFLTT